MTDTIPVIEESTAVREAYEMGHGRFEGADTTEHVGDMAIGDRIADRMDGFRSTATHSNIVLPRLREMAGFEDADGKGTYAHSRDVAVIPPGNEDDDPAESDVMRSSRLLDELTGAFERGAFDALHPDYEEGDGLD